MYDIHVTLDGDIIDLHTFSDEEYGFYIQCLNAYKTNMPRAEFLKLMQDPNNPMMKGSRFITKEIAKTDLYKAVQDLEDRLAIAQGKMSPNPGDLVNEEPAQKDDFVTANAAAQDAGVSPNAIIKAIKNKRLAGHQERERGYWHVSVRDLANYRSR